MRFDICMDILFTLLSRKIVSAGELAGRNDVSIRSIYRYVDEMTVSGIPIDVKHGRGGGIYISDSYKLPTGFMTKEEFDAAISAMQATQMEIPSDALRSAIEKLSARHKSIKSDHSFSGDVIVDSSSWGDYRFDEKLSLLQNAIHSTDCLEIDYIDRTGESTKRTVQPYVLISKNNMWYVWGYCELRKDFRIFKVGRIRTIRSTEKKFDKKPFRREDIPLNFTQEVSEMMDVKLSVSTEALPDAEEWLGVECIRKEGEQFVATITLPVGEGLVKKVLELGTGVKVLYPDSLKQEVKKLAMTIASAY